MYGALGLGLEVGWVEVGDMEVGIGGEFLAEEEVIEGAAGGGEGGYLESREAIKFFLV